MNQLTTRSSLCYAKYMAKVNIKALADALNFLDYAKEREAPFGGGPKLKPEYIVRKGIADLDFDPIYFLGTEQTSPEGWLVEKTPKE